MNSYDPHYMALKETKLQEIINKTKTVTTVAEELAVSRQTIHTWLSRYKRFGIDGLLVVKRKGRSVAHNRTSPEVEQLVVNIAHTYWNDGVETLHDHLLYEHNLALNPATIYRILKRNNVRYTSEYTRTQKRWKKQLFSHQTPGLELQMDTKYPFGYKQGKVVYTIIDDASRWVFAWSYGTANAENTVDFLGKVLHRAPFAIQKIRTDQGKEFIAILVEDFLRNAGILHRRNTPLLSRGERQDRAISPHTQRESAPLWVLPKRLSGDHAVQTHALFTVLQLPKETPWAGDGRKDTLREATGVCVCKLDAAMLHFLTKI